VYDFLKLIRFPNLLILAFTQYAIRWAMLAPFLEARRYELGGFFQLKFQISEFDFFLLVFSTVLIAAAGYIINDYFDVRIDEVNRPATNLVGKTIKRRVAMVTHMAFNIVGVLIGLWISWKYDVFRAGSFIFIAAPALLWFYSTSLKRQFLIGNIIIALLSGLIPLVGVIFELMTIAVSMQKAELSPEIIQRMNLIIPAYFAIGYSLFAFLVTLIREIVKDIEDYEGDMEYGCKTLPIVLGISKAKSAVIALCIGLLSGMGYILMKWSQVNQLEENANETGSYPLYFFVYVIAMLMLPVIFMMYRIWKAKTKKDWRFLSAFLKFIMVAGVSFLFLYAHQIRDIIGH
jgi:4-hydroxybenzoate polyprenyltransferase